MSSITFDASDTDGSLGTGEIVAEDSAVLVRMGNPAYFSIRIPRERIVDAAPIDASPRSRGAHGSRGKWLVNTSGRNLVRLTLAPSVRADLTPPQLGRVPLWLRPLVRNRSVSVSQITLSVSDVESAIRELRRK